VKRSKTTGGLIAAVAALSVTVTGLAQAPATQPSPEIKALISQLSSPDEATRTAAREKLVSMGDDARAALEAFVRSKSAAEAALAQIDTNAVAGPTLVTLDMKDADPMAVIAELAKQTKYDIQPYSQDNWDQGNVPRITITADKQPFWEVFRDMCKQANLSLVNSGDNQRALQLNPAGQGGRNIMQYPSSISGSFLMAISSLQRTNSVDLAHPDNIQHNLSMQMMVMAEPKVKVIRFSYQPKIEEAVDNKGNSLQAANRFGSGYTSSRGISFNANIPLQYPDNAGDKIATLRGSFQVTVQTRSETVEVPDILKAKDVTKSAGDLKITIKSVTKASDRQYRVDASFARGNMDQQAFYQLVQNPTMRLLDADGHEYRYSGYSSAGGNGDTYDVKINFYRNNNNDAGEPAKLVWEVATGTQEITVPFKFTDLPLP